MNIIKNRRKILNKKTGAFLSVQRPLFYLFVCYKFKRNNLLLNLNFGKTAIIQIKSNLISQDMGRHIHLVHLEYCIYNQ